MGSGFSGIGGGGPGGGGGEISNSNSKLGPGLEDIPERCLALVLTYLEPPHICRLAGLNRAFHRASSADFVWESKLPENYHILLNKLFNIKDIQIRADQNLVLKKDIYAMLRGPNRFAGATKVICTN